MSILILSIHFGVVLLITVGMMMVSYVLGERHRDKVTGEPYESGVKVTGSARTPYHPQFYLLALFFVIFDLEVVFLFAWAIAAPEVGWSGYLEVILFAGVLLAALFYLWRTGGLDWRSVQREAPMPKKRGSTQGAPSPREVDS